MRGLDSSSLGAAPPAWGAVEAPSRTADCPRPRPTPPVPVRTIDETANRSLLPPPACTTLFCNCSVLLLLMLTLFNVLICYVLWIDPVGFLV